MMGLKQSRFVFLWIFLLSCVLFAASTASSLNAQQQEDVLMKALKDEMNRSM